MKNHLFLKLQSSQKQRLVLTQKMRQVFHVLELPILELKEYIEAEIEQNPLYEKEEGTESVIYINKNNFKKDEDILDKIAGKKTLYDHLKAQALEAFSSEEELLIAESIFANLNSKGFLEIPHAEICSKLEIREDKFISVLEKAQTFDPPGVCARNLQESLLIQLKEKKEENSAPFEIIKNYFHDFLQSRRTLLLKNLKISKETLQRALDVIKTLKLNPISDFQHEIVPTLIPDIRIKYEKSKWRVFINEKEIPNFFINGKLINLPFEKEERKFVEANILKGKWLKEALKNRKKILGKITFFLIKHQKDYFLGNGQLTPLNLKSLSQELNMHISTISRAISNKYLECPRGIFPLKFFFSSSINSETNISNKAAILLLKNLIEEEDKNSPLSDDILSKRLSSQGISIARRTISKYRKKLSIASAKKRKIY